MDKFKNLLYTIADMFLAMVLLVILIGFLILPILISKGTGNYQWMWLTTITVPVCAGVGKWLNDEYGED